MPDSYGFPADDDAQPKKKPGPQPLSDDQLVAMLRREETDASSFYTSEIAMAQTDAMDAYNGKLKNDVILPNRSKAVTQDVRDTINWMVPALMRTFAPSDDFLTVDDPGLDDNDPVLTDAAEYLKWIFFKQNRGEEFVHDFAFDGLLQKWGIGRTYWCDPEPKPPYVITNVTLDQLAKYVNDPNYEILEWNQDGIEPEDETDHDDEEQAEAQGLAGDEAGEPAEPASPGTQDANQQAPGQAQSTALALQGQQPEEPEPTFTLKVQKIERRGKQVVECIPPEQFRISRRAKSIELADYHAWTYDEFLANLVRQHPDKAHEIDPEGAAQNKASDITDTDADIRVYARFPDEPSSGQRASYNEENRHKVQVSIEYIRIDQDGDGIVELRRCKRVGNVLLENEIVDESEFEVWSPNRVSHRAIGNSVAETVMDLQRIKTELFRRGLDNLAQATMPRTIVNKRAFQHDPTVLDRFLDHDIGDVIDIDGDPNSMVSVQQFPDVSQTCFNAVEYMDRKSEEASGVNRHAMGIQPQAITDTAKGIEALQSAANARIEQVARWLGYGLEGLFGKVLRSIIRNQDHERTIKVNGRKLNIDPRRWSDEMTVSVHVGMAGENRERKLAMLNDIKNDQAFAMKELGPGNPLVSIQQIRNTVARKAQIMGFKNPSEFWNEIDPNWQPPPQDQQMDPKLIEVQGKQQLAQAELQARMQLQQAELQHKDKVAGIEAQHKMAELQQQGQIQLQIEAQKAESEHQIARIKIESESQLAREKMENERQLALEKMMQEQQLAREAMQYKAAAPDTGVSSFRPGGKLDA